ncbi:MAG: hypothetical protein LC808_00670 [Actinobacteria bacterium]|nr:hypothetical protein [Actinomycetota bacterium]
MPLIVEIVGENHETRESMPLHPGAIERLLARAGDAGQLRYVDPYGDTYFNPLQARHLQAEWADLMRSDDEGPLQDVASAIQDMIRRVANGSHLYLKFVGD